ncbi:protein kinase domain-containing protein [Actinoplanes sp. CA-054009]
MGRVWQARDELLEREVAVKELAPDGLTAKELGDLRERAIREARAIARIDQANTVRIYDVVHDDTGTPWLVMELVRSRSLDKVLEEDGPLAPSSAARIGLDVLAALRAAHGAGILHRDVKPANILLAFNGRVVLTDFGLAAVAGDSAMTRTGIVLGSPSYLAPERALDEEPGAAADLWSLGATLYAAVEGRPPYDKSTPMATLAALMIEPPPPPQRAGVLLPVLERLLQRDPRNRAGADEAERLLRAAAAPVASADVPHGPAAAAPTAAAASVDGPAAPLITTLAAPVAVPRSSATLPLDGSSSAAPPSAAPPSAAPPSAAPPSAAPPSPAPSSGAATAVLSPAGGGRRRLWWAGAVAAVVVAGGAVVWSSAGSAPKETSAAPVVSESAAASEVPAVPEAPAVVPTRVVASAPASASAAVPSARAVPSSGAAPSRTPEATVTSRPAATTTTAAPVLTGIQISNHQTGTCLTAPDLGGPLRMSPCQSTTATQRFQFASDGTLRARGQCAQIPGPGNGSQLSLAACSGADYQKFELNIRNDLVNTILGKCVDVPADAAYVQIWDCAGTDNQKWN